MKLIGEATMSNEEHWNRVYEGRPTEELGWYEREASTLELVTAHSTPDDSVIDIGAGTTDLCRMHGTMPEDADQSTIKFECPRDSFYVAVPQGPRQIAPGFNLGN